MGDEGVNGVSEMMEEPLILEVMVEWRLLDMEVFGLEVVDVMGVRVGL